MKKFLTFGVLAILTSGFIFAQTSSLQEPNPENVGADSAMASLREVSLDKFEREGSWNASISPDNGIISARLFTGSPLGKQPLEENADVEDSKVLGVKAEFFRRGINSFYITAARPFPVEGITKTVSVWVAGRNQPHDLYLLVQD